MFPGAALLAGADHAPRDLFCCCQGDSAPMVQCGIKPNARDEPGRTWLKSIGRFARAALLCCRRALCDQGRGFGCSSQVRQPGPWDEPSASLVWCVGSGESLFASARGLGACVMALLCMASPATGGGGFSSGHWQSQQISSWRTAVEGREDKNQASGRELAAGDAVRAGALQSPAWPWRSSCPGSAPVRWCWRKSLVFPSIRVVPCLWESTEQDLN